MEPLAPFEIEDLRRDWIVGISGSEFFSRVEGCLKELEDGLKEIVIIDAADPIEFAAPFLLLFGLAYPSHWQTRIGQNPSEKSLRPFFRAPLLLAVRF